MASMQVQADVEKNETGLITQKKYMCSTLSARQLPLILGRYPCPISLLKINQSLKSMLIIRP